MTSHLHKKLQMKHLVNEATNQVLSSISSNILQDQLQVSCSEFSQSLLYTYKYIFYHIFRLPQGFSVPFYRALITLLPALVIACGSGGHLKIPF